VTCPVPQTAISEIDVLIPTALWLQARKVWTYRFSIAHGQGIDLTADENRLREALPKDYPYVLSLDGPDIEGISSAECWRIECKRSGTGKQSTQRNNFDRGLASVVSYCIDTPPDLKFGQVYEYEKYKDANIHLGLALPETTDYLRELKRRVRRPLRQRLNLWILLYQTENQTLRAVSPEDEY